MKYINKCTICKHDEFRNIGTPRIDKNFPRKNTSDYLILQCKKCGYYFISPEIDLTIEEWQILYENEYFLGEDITRWQKRLRESERKKRLGIIINRLKCNNGNFLDMGCGEGYLLKDAEKIGFSTYGVDIANNILNENSGCNFFKGSIFEANFPDNFFKVIYMDSVLEHIINPMETLSELKRILEPGGVIFFNCSQ